MLNYIKGILEEKAVDKIVVENNGIGYEILTSLNTIEEIKKQDKLLKKQLILFFLAKM